MTSSWYDRRKAAQLTPAPPPLPIFDVSLATFPSACIGFLSLGAGVSINYSVRREEQGGYVWSIGGALLAWQLTICFWRYEPTPKSQRA